MVYQRLKGEISPFAVCTGFVLPDSTLRWPDAVLKLIQHLKRVPSMEATSRVS